MSLSGSLSENLSRVIRKHSSLGEGVTGASVAGTMEKMLDFIITPEGAARNSNNHTATISRHRTLSRPQKKLMDEDPDEITVSQKQSQKEKEKEKEMEKPAIPKVKSNSTEQKESAEDHKEKDKDKDKDKEKKKKKKDAPEESKEEEDDTQKAKKEKKEKKEKEKKKEAEGEEEEGKKKKKKKEEEEKEKEEEEQKKKKKKQNQLQLPSLKIEPSPSPSSSIDDDNNDNENDDDDDDDQSMTEVQLRTWLQSELLLVVAGDLAMKAAKEAKKEKEKEKTSKKAQQQPQQQEAIVIAGQSLIDQFEKVSSFDSHEALKASQDLFDLKILIPVSLLASRSMTTFDASFNYVLRLKGLTKRAQQDCQSVFTAFAPCYSPSCRNGQPCYSSTCSRAASKVNATRNLGQAREWGISVGKSVAAQISKREFKRQEIIFEMALTEEDYVQDLKMMKKLFVDPMSSSAIMPPEKATGFIQKLFLNLTDLIEVNSKLSAALRDRQREKPVVDLVADIFLKHIPDFAAYISYCPYVVNARLLLIEELKVNPALQAFLKKMQRSTECRKLPLENLLMFPVQRLPRYNLFLSSILKETDPQSKDFSLLKDALVKLASMLEKVDKKTGVESNRSLIRELVKKLVIPESHKAKSEIQRSLADLNLQSSKRRLVYSGKLLRRKEDSSSFHPVKVFLFDNGILVTKVSNLEEDQGTLKITDPILPMELVEIHENSELQRLVARNPSPSPTRSLHSTSAPSIKKSSSMASFASVESQEVQNLCLCIRSHGGMVELVALNIGEKNNWVQYINEAKQELLSDSMSIFNVVDLVTVTEQVKCAAPIVNKSFDVTDVLLGTASGLSVIRGVPSKKDRCLVKLTKGSDISDLQVRFDSQMVFYCFGESRKVGWFPLKEIHQKTFAESSMQKIDGTKRSLAFRVAGKSTQLFLCCIRSEPPEKGKGISVSLNELNKVEKTGAIKPNLLYELKGLVGRSFSVRLDLFPEACVISNKGISLVSFANSALRSFPQDKVEISHPYKILKVDDKYLICTRERGILVQKDGSLFPGVKMTWIYPTDTFAYMDPYVMCFHAQFMEIRYVHDGTLAQLIPGAFTLLSSNDDTNPYSPVVVSRYSDDGQCHISFVDLRD